MDSKFEKVMVLGSGQLAYKCAELARQYISVVEVLELKVTESTILEKLCGKAEIPYRCVERKGMTELLLQEQKETLIVSAGNTYLFPETVISQKNLEIINWHNALLPYHKGRNAEVWAIYEGDGETGVTWHRITKDVDAGDILCQSALPIDEKLTAMQLYKKQCELGETMFAEILESVLTGTCEAKSQEKLAVEQLHYSYERPNNGILDLSRSMEQISCFLRAMDYGSLLLLGKMKVVYEGKLYSFYRYKLKVSEDFTEGRVVTFEEGNLTIKEGNRMIVLRDLQEEES
ncbi:MAG: hypothetical protein IJX63_02435 [Lachnospiraceae bacterium]|nr:hypothetical protein [Lachnospiraceae bacterium]